MSVKPRECSGQSLLFRLSTQIARAGRQIGNFASESFGPAHDPASNTKITLRANSGNSYRFLAQCADSRSTARFLLLTSDERTSTPIKRILLHRSISVKSIRIMPRGETGTGQSVSFVLAIGSARQACILKTTFKTQSQALSYLQKHRTAFEGVARNLFERGEVDDGVVRLRML
jgi:hypothetical protein